MGNIVQINNRIQLFDQLDQTSLFLFLNNNRHQVLAPFKFQKHFYEVTFVTSFNPVTPVREILLVPFYKGKKIKNLGE